MTVDDTELELHSIGSEHPYHDKPQKVYLIHLTAKLYNIWLMVDLQLLTNSLFALLIGINNYGGTSGIRLQASEDSTPNSRSSSQFLNLRGAVPDAKAFKKYLLHTLKVDESHITMLLDEQATRVNIIDAFEKLAKNDNITKDDSIFIFYAGHGQQALPPTRLTKITGCPEKVELIIPYGTLLDTTDHQHMAIPDFTLAALIDKIAKEKGNRIVCRTLATAIFCKFNAMARPLLSIVAILHRLCEGRLLWCLLTIPTLKK